MNDLIETVSTQMSQKSVTSNERDGKESMQKAKLVVKELKKNLQINANVISRNVRDALNVGDEKK